MAAKQDVKRLVDHMFLPPKLPHSADNGSHLFLVRATLRALSKWQPVHDLEQKSINRAIASLRSILAIHTLADDGIDQPHTISLLQKLRAGGTIALHIRAQNAAVLFTRQQDSLLVDVFELSARNTAVTGTKGRLVRDFPGCSVSIPAGALDDADFTPALVSTLAAMDAEPVPEMQPKSHKSGVSHDETRDTTQPLIVSELLVALLCSVGSRVSVPGVRKHTRDEINWDQCFEPWRRSPMWLLVRVLLQLVLHRTNPGQYHILYKKVILFVLGGVLDQARLNEFSCDELYCMTTKLDQKMKKIMRSSDSVSQAEFSIRSVMTSMQQVDQHLERTWRMAQEIDTQAIDISTFEQLNAVADTEVQLPWLNQHIDEIRSREGSTRLVTFCPVKEMVVFEADQLPALPQQTPTNPSYSLANLQAFEDWIHLHLETWASGVSALEICRGMQDLTQAYHKLALQRYDGNPEAMSKMLLTVFEMWVASDRAITQSKSFQMLTDYDPGIETRVLQNLLLSSAEQMRRLAKVETYLFARKQGSTMTTRQIFTTTSQNGFPSRYSRSSRAHVNLLQQVLKDGNARREVKLTELRSLQQQHQQLDTLARQTPCQTEERQVDDWYGVRVETFHSPRCQSCEYGRKRDRLKINLFEYPVPASQVEAEAIVFELCVPEVFAHWRDLRSFLLQDVLGGKIRVTHNDVEYTLAGNDPHLSSAYFKGSRDRRIGLLSTVKPAVVTHYQSKPIASATPTNVCVPNALRYRYYDANAYGFDEDPTFDDTMAIKCTYAASRPTLQRFLLRTIDAPDGLPHNETVARQDSCPLDMSCEEFKALLSLPLGRFLQWLNVGRELAMPMVDFRKADTACFFLQCIYQSGPAGGSFLRQSHEILLEPGLANMLVGRLREALQRVRQNWGLIHALATFIAVAGRIATLDTSSKLEALQFLAEAREVAAQWTRTLVKKSHEAHADPDRLAFQSRSFESALVCLATFDVDNYDASTILASASHTAIFVEMSIIVEECANSRNRNDSLINIYHLRIQRMLHRLCERVLANSYGLTEGIRKAWSGFPDGLPIWTRLADGCSEWVTTEVTSTRAVVHYNLMTGRLLVNGEPLNEPPTSYRDQPLFKALFGIHRVEVMPSFEPGFQYSTKRRFGDFDVLLGMGPKDNLLVRVINKEGVEWEVIPESMLDGVYPRHFVRDFIHWLNLSTDTIHLASTSSCWPTELNHCWSMTKSTGDRRWAMKRGDESLINLKAPVALAVKALLSPLAIESNIHTTINHHAGDLNIEMPLSALKFHTRATDMRLYSKDCQNMYIAGDQYLGTLVGLKNKLLLTSDSGDKIALIPEASLLYSRADSHMSVTVDVSGPSRVHAFEIDCLLHRLVGKNEMGCQLYLVYLHALTSSCLPDPLLGCTGTERALEILRSKSMKSHSVLQTSHVEMLAMIAGLSPKRWFYPKHLESMQCTTWKTSLSTMTQSDDFVTVAEDLIGHFERQKSLPMTHLDFESPQIGRSSTRALRDRAINRYSYLRVSLHGAEAFSTSFDRAYKARDSGWSIRANNSYKMAVMLSQSSVSSFWPTVPKGGLLDVFLRVAPTVSGAATAVEMGEIQYSAACLTQETFGKIMASFPAFQSWLTSANNVAQHKYALRIWLSSLSFAEDADLKTIQVLALMSQSIFQHDRLDTPKQPMYHLQAGMELNKGRLNGIAHRHKHALSSCPESQLPRTATETKAQHSDRKHRVWQAASSQSANKFARTVESQWPCRRPTVPSDSGPYLNLISAFNETSHVFEQWFDNKQFSEYLGTIEDRVSRVPSGHIEEIKFPNNTISSRARERGFLSIAEMLLKSPPTLADHPPALAASSMCYRSKRPHWSRLETVIHKLSQRNTSRYEKTWISDLDSSLKALKRQKGAWVLVKQEVHAAVDHHLEQQQDHVHEIEQRLQQFLTVDDPLYVFGCRHRCPRVRPMLFLQQLRTHQWEKLSPAWQRALVHYALAMCNLQRAQRMKQFCDSPEDLLAELQNVGHDAWDPLQHPEWLILEVESGLTIRTVQHEIAREMILPSSGRNSVMQLNMGEGKSTVIVPMIVLALADGSRLMRVIVNRPQSKQMLQMLVSKFGGIIDRQIYQLPFARTSRLDDKSAATVMAILQECMVGGGVLLMQPEHILSLQHMALEYYILGDPTLSQRLLEIQNFMDRNARDVIDESDENFSVNLELIYTMGQQQFIEASPNRWRLPQHVLGIIRELIHPLAQNRPQDFEIIPGKPGSFPRLRLLTTQAGIVLLESVVDHISKNGTAGLQLSKQTASIRDALKRYISVPDLTEEETAAVESSSMWTDTTQPLILILRGLFAKGLMTFALGQKRWRVNYGLADRTPPTRLAVPYRAKDCPALRSEFSHPDVVITLTCLCYYYKGLTDANLFEALAHLLDSDQADNNYQIWLADAPDVEPSFRALQGVNLEDRTQCVEKLFPSLQFSKAAIDYFLSELVFPKEIREFPTKLSASGWDIGKLKGQTTTGFSGTNDSRPTLPLDMSFLDLAKQKHTNALVLEHILQTENSVQLLKPPQPGRTDAESILQQVLALDPPVQVILDAGAQVLEDNLAFARSWLEQDQCKEAVVFVDEADNVSVVDRQGKVDFLHASPFVSSLPSCLVFLDQAHTRGIDLKLPRSYRAAVTLGPRLIKDNLVQACMRMRKLGQGQSVVFLVPQDVGTLIKEQRPHGQEITTAEVIEWAISETFIANRRSMPLWKVQGQRYLRHRRVWKAGLQGTNAGKLLEKECQEIELRYRPHFVDQSALDACQEIASDPDSFKLEERCRQFGQTNLELTGLQEEQERELAPEIEQEVERQRPPSMKAAAHELHQDVITFAKTGRLSPSATAYMAAFMSLVDTSPAQHFSLAQLGASPVKATRDFMRTVRQPSGGTFVSDLFLRSVHWLLVATTADGSDVSAIMIISPYEANKLRPHMKDYATRLCVYAPRCNQGYRPMDSLEFERVPTDAPSATISLHLVAILNALAGQLYFSTYDHYKAFGAAFGLSTQLITTSMEQAGYRVDGQGYILSDEYGRRGGAWGPVDSAVRFLKDFTLIRNGGRAFIRTHLGEVLDGRTFFRKDFL
jgi:hypothetical protein